MKYKVVIEGYMESDLDPEDYPDSTIESEIEDAFFADPLMFLDMMDEDISVNVEKID